MDAAQMLAHCNVTYELVFEIKHPKPNFMVSLLLKFFVKKMVTNKRPYQINTRTAPVFLIKENKDFRKEIAS